MKHTVSIIIPAYNCSATIRRCIDSLLNQSYQQIEIIVVDDGSIDDTYSVIKHYAEVDDRVVPIHKTNGGVSSTRNAGLIKAKGEFITFVDADDYVSPEYISDFFDESSNINPDIIIQLPTKIRHSDGAIIPNNFKFDNYETVESTSGIEKSRLLQNGHAHGKLVRRDIVERYVIRFDESISYKEDLLFYLNYLKHCKTITQSPGKGYYYILYDNSLSNRWKNPEELVEINSRIIRRANELNVPKSYLEEFEKFHIAESLFMAFNFSNYQGNKFRLIKSIKENLTTGIYPVENKADKILSRLFHCNMFRTFTVVKKLTNFLLLKFYK